LCDLGTCSRQTAQNAGLSILDRFVGRHLATVRMSPSTFLDDDARARRQGRTSDAEAASLPFPYSSFDLPSVALSCSVPAQLTEAVSPCGLRSTMPMARDLRIFPCGAGCRRHRYVERVAEWRPRSDVDVANRDGALRVSAGGNRYRISLPALVSRHRGAHAYPSLQPVSRRPPRTPSAADRI